MERELLQKIVDQELRSSAEVASELKITKQGVAKLVSRGELKPVKIMNNASLFLEMDLEKIKIRKKLISVIESRPIYDISEFDNVVRVDDVVAVFIYFYMSEATLDDFYTTERAAKKDVLTRIESPTFVVKYSDLSEVYFKGANCGYSGHGPLESIEILRDKLKVPENTLEQVYYARSLKLYNEGGLWRAETIYRENETKDDGFWEHQMIHFIYNNQLVALIDLDIESPYYFLDLEEDDFDKLRMYSWFIPNPDTITFYPLDVALSTGHYVMSSTYTIVYPVVVRDYSGHELWININIDQEIALVQQKKVMGLLNVYGFDFRANSKNKNKESFVEGILNHFRKLDSPITFNKYLDVK